MPRRVTTPAVPEGEPLYVEQLLRAEAALGVVFPDVYRDFVVNRDRYGVAVRRVMIFPVERCERVGDEIIIGMSFNEGRGELVFKQGRGRQLGEAVYERQRGRLVRRPDFGEFVRKEPGTVAPPSDERVRAAELLAGILKACRVCGKPVRVGQTCTEGAVGQAGDAKYLLSDEEREALRREQPLLSRAWDVLVALKERGTPAPMGSNQVLLIAQALEQHGATAAAAKEVLATWKEKGLAKNVEPRALESALSAAQ